MLSFVHKQRSWQTLVNDFQQSQIFCLWHFECAQYQSLIIKSHQVKLENTDLCKRYLNTICWLSHSIVMNVLAFSEVRDAYPQGHSWKGINWMCCFKYHVVCVANFWIFHILTPLNKDKTLCMIEDDMSYWPSAIDRFWTNQVTIFNHIYSSYGQWAESGSKKTSRGRWMIGRHQCIPLIFWS